MIHIDTLFYFFSFVYIQLIQSTIVLMKNIYIIIAKQIVEEAGRIIREARDTNMFEFVLKEDETPVTPIDQQVQDYMTKRLRDGFDIQVMGEENCDEIDASKPYWAIDPIDGTWAFITHENTSAINLSLIEEGEVSVAVVYNPFTDELFFTEKGKPSFIGLLKLPLRSNNEVTVVNFKPIRNSPVLQTLGDLYQKGKIKKLVSIGGSLSYGVCMVAKGAFSNYLLYFDTLSHAWDLSASILILRNAGGFVTDLEGNDIDPISYKGFIVASASKRCRDEFLDMLAPLRKDLQ